MKSLYILILVLRSACYKTSSAPQLQQGMHHIYVVCQNYWNSLFLNRKKWRFDKDLRLVVAYRCLGRAVKAMELNWQILLIITLKVKTFTQRHWSCKCFVRVFIQQNPCKMTKYLFMRRCLKDKFHVHCILRGESREKI